jgi:hypothetical protein
VTIVMMVSRWAINATVSPSPMIDSVVRQILFGAAIKIRA